MPTGQPDPLPEIVETTADRIIREAMQVGDFDDLPGVGRPIPGAGTVDDDMWWVRSWLEQNRDRGESGFEQTSVDPGVLGIEAGEYDLIDP